jgi:hypothetical protein
MGNFVMEECGMAYFSWSWSNVAQKYNSIHILKRNIAMTDIMFPRVESTEEHRRASHWPWPVLLCCNLNLAGLVEGWNIWKAT